MLLKDLRRNSFAYTKKIKSLSNMVLQAAHTFFIYILKKSLIYEKKGRIKGLNKTYPACELVISLSNKMII